MGSCCSRAGTCDSDGSNFSELYCLSRIFTNKAEEEDAVSKLEQFSLFPNLPLELRLRIWEFALPDSFLIVRTFNNDRLSYALRRRVPTMLQVCRETRHEFTRTSRPSHYELLQQRSGEEGYIYIDWSRDEVFIPRGYSITSFEFSQLQNLHLLKMSWGLRPCWVEGSLNAGVRFLKRLPNLKTVVLVVSFGPSQVSSARQQRKMENRELRRIAALVLSEFHSQHRRDTTWKTPQLRVVHFRQSGLEVSWNI